MRHQKQKTYAPVKPARSYAEQARRLMEVHNLEVEDARAPSRSFPPSTITA